ncbi:RidA family protein [Mariniflexile gromovii]|uniref:RidA family protein n=1 Tax=Mariniflexile gromovii TaxID=362523 RepID=A0ABS4BYD4_9FLAO|nr:RidA family protein [Mariniflexile gromovii]MBP0905052.1 RidA family protein [Mariniflexile gromovii]
MNESIKKKVADIGIQLPNIPEPGGNYKSVEIRGNVGYVAIQFPIHNGINCHQGKLGKELSTNDGYLAMRLCALNVLAQINQYVSYNKLEGLNHVFAYYRCSNEWDDGPLVVNGASDLFNEVLKDKGSHSRTLFGVCSLPRNFSVGLTATFTIL